MSLRRGPPTAWSRLKTPPSDALEDVGLVSKGDKRLLDLNRQEKYFSIIMDRYMRYCYSASRKDRDLEEAFRTFSFNHPVDGTDPQPEGTTSESNELDVIIMSMRKLREALVATTRTDGFALRALLFIARATILTSTYDAYFPAILRLLQHVHPKTPLSHSELREFVGYLVLDFACRQGMYSDALLAKHRWALKDPTIDRILQTLIRDDWVSFWHLRSSLGAHHRRLLGFAEPEMRKHALKCVGRTYLKVDMAYLEKCTQRKWSDLCRLDNVTWELDGDDVVIRKIVKKTT